MTVWGWPLPVLVAALLVSLAAGAVRGFAGFGYSALTVAGLSIFVAPKPVVPAVMLLEILASITMLRSSLREADRSWLRPLLLWNLLVVPLGLALLIWLPPTILRLVVGSALLVSAVALKLTSARHYAPSLALRTTAGIASGLLNGVAASGGIAAAMLMAAARVPTAALRGTMVTFLLFCGSYILLCAAIMPSGPGPALLGSQTLRWAALLAPTMMAGIWLGSHAFGKARGADHRQHVLTLLIVIAGLGVLRAGYDLVAV